MNNEGQVFTAVLWLMALALPPGLLSLRAMGLLPSWRNFAYYPVGFAFGAIVIPLFWFLGATFDGGAISLTEKILIWGFVVVGLLITNIFSANRPKEHSQQGEWPACIGLVVVTIPVMLITLYPFVQNDITTSDGRWRTHTGMHDWSKHIPVAISVATSDNMPPPNPFLSSDPQMLYHYFGYLLPATVHNLAGNFSIANSLIANAVLIAASLPACVFLYGRAVGLNPFSAWMTTFVVSLVGGLDYLYMLNDRIQYGIWPSHIDGWISHADRRINGIPDMYLWTPHHVLGLSGFVLTLWLVQQLAGTSRREHLLRVIGLALILAGMSGSTSLSWAVLVGSLGVFVLIEGWRWWRGKTYTPFMPIVFAIVASLCLGIPHFAHIFSSNRPEGGPIFIAISPTKTGLIYGGFFSYFFGPATLSYALDFPFQMIPEFGVVLFIGFAGWWMVRRRWREWPEFRLWTLMLPVFFFTVLAAREGRVDTNNYAPRIAPMAMILLGILGGFWWERRRDSRLWRWWILRVCLFLMTVVGLGTALYEPNILHDGLMYTPIVEYEVYEWLNQHLEKEDIYQFGPQQYADVVDEDAMYFVERRAGLANPWLSEAFTADVRLYEQAVLAVQDGYKLNNAKGAAFAFKSIGVDYAVSADYMPIASIQDQDFHTYFESVFSNFVYTIYRVK